jgi:geranylgeranyl reductase family protein
VSEQSRDRRATVAILGAGPAGAACAAHLGQLGVQDVVLVDRHDFPRDKTCGSGLSPKGIKTLKDLGIWHEIEPLSYPINGIRLVTPGGLESWQSAGTKAEAVVCERRVLDHKLLQKAVSRGTEFIPNFQATAVLEKNGRVEGFRSSEGAEIRARFVVIAGGAHCRIGLPEQRPRQTIQAIMGWWSGVDFRPNHVEMIFDKMLSPYYGWLFPEAPDRVNIGITYEDSADAPKHNARELFQKFLDKHYKTRIEHAQAIKSWKGHPVVWSYTPEKLTRPGAVVVGESGLMTHPATAEGIYQAMRSGMLAAEAISDITSRGFEEAKAFASYEAACRRTFRASFLAGGAFRRVMRTNALDWVVRAGQNPAVQSVTAKLLASI